ncbi:MAG: hypothetical protein H6Q04_574 [Acidobacteria bacterium]|nr:hypothetical protein [Acidobacteriota bacterium]
MDVTKILLRSMLRRLLSEMEGKQVWQIRNEDIPNPAVANGGLMIFCRQ